MMSGYHLDIFISHSWAYSDHYEKLSEWVFGENWSVDKIPLTFGDRSVPKYDPIHSDGSEANLREAIYERIKLSNVVVIPTGMYANHSKWIQKEIDGALAYGKPILAVDPWGQQRKSSVVSQAAHATVGWSKQGVVKGIWDLYRS